MIDLNHPGIAILNSALWDIASVTRLKFSLIDRGQLGYQVLVDGMSFGSYRPDNRTIFLYGDPEIINEQFGGVVLGMLRVYHFRIFYDGGCGELTYQ